MINKQLYEKTILPLIALDNPSFLAAQNKFRIELAAPSFINEGIIISPPSMRTGFEDFYTYTLDTNKNISAFGKQFGLNLAAYQIRIQEKNMLEGEFNYPIPLTF